MRKKISICVAIYNIKNELLRECIESVLYDKSEDVEIILGDDCSENGCGGICREFAENDSRIIYLRHEKNGGVSKLRNSMADAASGDYIAFIDGDDVVSKYYTQTVRTAAESGFDIIMFEWQRFEKTAPQSLLNNSDLKKLPHNAGIGFSKACLTGAPPEIERYGMKASTPSSVCNKIYKREFLNKNNLRFREGLKKSQDVEFNTRAFNKCETIGYINETLYFYRKNPTSVCNRYSCDISAVINNCIDYDKKNLKTLYNNDKECIRLWQRYKLLHFLIERFSLDIFHSDNPKSAQKRKKDFCVVVDSKMYKDFFESFDYDSYNWNERKLVLKLASKKNFGLLDFMYKRPVSFRIYGRVKKITDTIGKR